MRERSLAIFDSAPAFDAPLHVGRPNIGDRGRLLQRIEGALDRRWLTNAGPLCQELESKIATLCGVKHCLCMCNATVALEIAIRAADLRGEVVVPSSTFVATAHALQWQEITPVFCDMDPATHNIDPRRVEALITPRTTGILGVHVWGRACDADALGEIAARHRLKLLFDAAHAFACSHRGRMIGGFGLAEVFSFHATKFFNTFEGGAVVTNDDALAEKMRLMRNFGFAGFDNVVYVGTNGKMSEVSAAMGLTGLESLDEFVGVNRENYHAYRAGLSDLPGLQLIRYDERERCNYQYVVIEVDPSASPLSRDELVAVLHAENVLARKYFWPGVHRMQPYKALFPNAHLLLPETERVAPRVFLVPSGTALPERAVETICEILRAALRDAPRVRRRLAERGASAAVATSTVAPASHPSVAAVRGAR